MKKNIKVIVLSSLSTLLVCLLAFALFLHFNGGSDSAFAQKIAEINALLDGHAVMDFPQQTAEDDALHSYVSALDDIYASYMSKEEYDAYQTDAAGNATGIGITVLTTDVVQDGIFISRAIGGSPAEQAGIRAGDLIVSLNGESILGRNYTDVYNEMLGEAGTDLQLTVLRDGASLNFTVTREFYHQRSVDHWMLDNKIGFIRIHSFNRGVGAEFEEALNDLLAQGVRGWVFDLRNNPGGSLDEVEQVVSALIPKDELVVLQFKNGEEVHYSTGKQKTQLPMVVLINGSSASASELMASALRDVNAAPLVGLQSFGKGIGQTTYRLSDGSALKMTTFYYLTKSRTYYHGTGLVPDVEVGLSEEKEKYFYALSTEEDDQLQAALDQLEQQIALRGND